MKYKGIGVWLIFYSIVTLFFSLPYLLSPYSSAVTNSQALAFSIFFGIFVIVLAFLMITRNKFAPIANVIYLFSLLVALIIGALLYQSPDYSDGYGIPTLVIYFVLYAGWGGAFTHYWLTSPRVKSVFVN